MNGNPDAKIIYTGPSPRGWHRLQLAAECLQKYAWNYEVPKPKDRVTSAPLAKGSLIHLALAQHYARIRAGLTPDEQDLSDLAGVADNVEDWVDPARAVDLISQLEGTQQYAGVALDAYRAYVKHYPHDATKWKILEIEEIMEVQIAGRYRLTGRADLVIEDLGGRVWVVDHKCQPGSATVLSPEGLITIEALVKTGKDWTCCAWDEGTNRTVWTPALAPIDAGVQDVYVIGLADGTSESYGYRHPLLTEKGWKQVKDLREGDWVAVAAPPHLPNRALPDNVLRVLGLALSDGARAEKGQPYVVSALCPEVRDYLTQALDALGDSWALVTHKGVAKGIRLRLGGQAQTCIEDMGIQAKLSVDKVFPRELMSLAPTQAAILLGSLWEGDGAAYLGTPSKKSGNRPVRIMFSSRSRGLAEGVRHLLLQLGILANVTESRVVGAPYYQTVVVGRSNKSRFLGLVLEGTIDCPVTRAGGRKTRSGRVLDSCLELLQTLDSTEPKGVDTRVRGLNQGRHKNPCLENGIRWVKVTSALFAGRERCYDIEVPKYHTFLTGHCVVTHNSTARLTARHKQFYSVSGQLLGYSHMGRQKYGDRFAGLIVNLIQHGTPKFERIVLPRSPNLEAKFERIVVDIEESVERIQAEGRDPSDWPKAINELTCYHRYGPCDFIDQCRWGAGAGKAGNWTWEDQ